MGVAIDSACVRTIVEVCMGGEADGQDQPGSSGPEEGPLSVVAL
jgi:hypothetical protein